MRSFVQFEPSEASEPIVLDASDRASVLVADLAEDFFEYSLRDRLKRIGHVGECATVLLRGVTRSSVDFDDSELQDLVDAFGTSCSIGIIAFSGGPWIDWIIRIDGCPSDEEAFDAALSIDIVARLECTQAIWTAKGFHFRLPSGMHTPCFVRIADLLASPLHTSRLVDWIAYQIPLGSVLVLDTPTLLPLAQELRIRHLTDYGKDLARIVVLPQYAMSVDEAERRLISNIPTSFDTDASIACLVSVSASGGYVRRFEELVSRLNLSASTTVVVCEASPEATNTALCHVAVNATLADECLLCLDSGETALEIDATRFAARTMIGIQQFSVPPASDLEKLREFLECGTRSRAFRVHSTSPETRKHRSIDIHVERLLADEGAAAKVRLELQRAILDWQPDLIVVVRGAGDRYLESAVAELSAAHVAIVSADEEISDSLRALLASCTALLVLVGCVSSSRTLRSVLESLQRAAAPRPSLEVHCLVVLSRPSTELSMRGLRNRFFINGTPRLRKVWEVPLPADDAGHSCPWCRESHILAALSSEESSAAQQYVISRLRRLEIGEGMSGQIFLLSEQDTDSDDGRAAVSATPSAYFGCVDDVAAFVGASSVVLKSQWEWRANPSSLTHKLVFSFASIARTFTDPVIIAAFLRALRLRDIDAPRGVEDFAGALAELSHAREHQVFSGELLLAVHRGLLQPSAFPSDWIQRRVANGDVLGELTARTFPTRADTI